jgi:hypothetical protein
VALLAGEHRGVGGGVTTDDDGRMVVVGPGGQPISGSGGTSSSVDIVDRAGRVLGTVDVANFPAATDVSDRAGRLLGHVTVDNPISSVQVSNLPATQLVSGQVNVGNFPATQPVSGPLTDQQLRAAAVPVTVGNWPATQQSRALKDTARTHVLLSVAGVASVVSEAFFNLNINQPGAVTTGSTFTVPAGKTLRIQALQFGARFATMSATATFANVTFRIRLGATTSSPLLLSDSKAAASNAATPNSDLAIPDGLELPAGTQLGITQQASAATLSLDAILVGFLY